MEHKFSIINERFFSEVTPDGLANKVVVQVKVDEDNVIAFEFAADKYNVNSRNKIIEELLNSQGKDNFRVSL